MLVRKAFNSPSPAAFRAYEASVRRWWWAGVGGFGAVVAAVLLAATGLNTGSVVLLAVVASATLGTASSLTSSYRSKEGSSVKEAQVWRDGMRRADVSAAADLGRSGFMTQQSASWNSVEDALVTIQANAAHIRRETLDMLVARDGAGQPLIELVEKVAPLIDPSRFPDVLALYELWRPETMLNFEELRSKRQVQWSAAQAAATAASATDAAAKQLALPAPSEIPALTLGVSVDPGPLPEVASLSS